MDEYTTGFMVTENIPARTSEQDHIEFGVGLSPGAEVLEGKVERADAESFDIAVSYVARISPVGVSRILRLQFNARQLEPGWSVVPCGVFLNIPRPGGVTPMVLVDTHREVVP